MLLNEIKTNEMTMVNPNDQTDQQAMPFFEFLQNEGTHIGDQGSQKIFHASHGDYVTYGIERDGEISTIASFKQESSNPLTLYVVHTLTPHRGKNDVFKLLWFIKDQERKPIVDYGVQTSSGQRLADALSKSKRFSVSWVNTETGEQQAYDPEKKEKFTSNHTITPWRVMIESATVPTFSRYRDEKSIVPLHELRLVFTDDEIVSEGEFLYTPNIADKQAVEMKLPSQYKNYNWSKSKTRKEKVTVKDTKTGKVYGQRTVVQKYRG